MGNTQQRQRIEHGVELQTPGFDWPAEMRPRKWQLNALQPGRIVRLYLRTGQAVWARVISTQQRDGCYLAEVEDSPALWRGAPLCFRKENVFEVS